MSQTAAGLLLGTWLALTGLSYEYANRPPTLSMAFAACNDGYGLCVAQLSPSGKAVEQGAKLGMRAICINGQEPQSYDRGDVATQALVLSSKGRVLILKKALDLAASPIKYSLWVLSSAFAFLGALVITRRFDSSEAQIFGLFSWFAAISIAVSPVAAGTGYEWSKYVMTVFLTGLSAAFLPVTHAIVPTSIRGIERISGAFATAAIALGVVTLLSRDLLKDWYSVVRSIWVGMFVASMVISCAYLLVEVIRARGKDHFSRAKVCVAGMGLGVLPFAVFMIPQVSDAWFDIPLHWMVLSIGFLPLAYTVAILGFGFLDIRRLVHSEMIETTLSVFAALLVAGLGALIFAAATIQPTAPWIGATALAAIPLFFCTRWSLTKVFGRFLSKQKIDIKSALQTVRRELGSPAARESAGRLMDGMLPIVQLESATLFLGPDPTTAQPAVLLGDRAEQVVASFGQRCGEYVAQSDRNARRGMELRWRSEALMVVPLELRNRYLGHVVWGPKMDGDVFTDDEKQLLTALGPILSLVVEQRMMTDELRELNRRLLKAEEAERARIARDLHDGPLQKAIVLTGQQSPKAPLAKRQLGRQLVEEIREICTQLRPAILDDLGLPSAIDWLLSSQSAHIPAELHLSFEGVREDNRFQSDAELCLYRFIQEGIANAGKHSKATNVKVTLGRTDQALFAQVTDDGCGFSLDQLTHRGFGLAGMRERLRELDGIVVIDSREGQGTTVRGEIPWERARLDRHQGSLQA